MKALIVHQNFPGQYAHIAPALRDRGDEVAVISAREHPAAAGLRLRTYAPPAAAAEEVRYGRFAENALRRAERVAEEALALRREGFRPDVMAAHLGWGEAIFLKDVFPTTPLLLYGEFFYSPQGADVGFMPDEPVTVQTAMRVRAMNAPLLMAMQAADWGISPTRWQRDRMPPWFRERTSLVHDGVDTATCRPDPEASFTLPNGEVLRVGDEIVTYVSRGLEPYRGFPTFARTLPRLLRERPNLRIVVVGDDQPHYGRAPTDGGTWKNKILAELGELDPARLFFTGRIPYAALLNLFRVSMAHVYLTVPFVLSWSTLEAMACGALLVASSTPPVTEVIQDGRNGLLTDFHDSEALAERLLTVLADPARYASLRQAARRTVVERYDLARICLPRQLSLIDALAARRRPSTFA
ncbi:glycosyltransferase [Roseomonas elaeocarpi]|uniref:Glycosyltransferase n=1 Tax=Roseomonas elaeocarpi TaxID=907779 RepID=A0ABV6JVR3_9PROT